MPSSAFRNAPDEAPTRTAEVFRAAAELMFEKGYGATSIGDIAQAVGMTKAGLYHHISGKQDMLFQILNHAIDEAERMVTTPVRLIDDPEQRLRQLMRLQIQGSLERGLAFTALFSEINHLPPAQQMEIRSRVREQLDLIRGTLLELADQGRIRELDADIATMMILNVFTGIARWKYTDIASDREHLIQEAIAYTMAAILKPKK